MPQMHPTIDSDEQGRVSAEAYARVQARVCRYKCGDCTYDETDTWSAHNAHHNTHGGTA